MAHTCPYCGQICHCGGDIDDLVFDRETYCSHCNDDEDDDFPNDLDDEEVERLNSVE